MRALPWPDAQPGRDKHLPYRFIDAAHARLCTRNPPRCGQIENHHYHLLNPEEL